MRRKDGKPKRRARRATPEFTSGFRGSPATAGIRHPNCGGTQPANAIPVVSMFAGCGGMDLGFQGGFRYLGGLFAQHPFSILAAYDSMPDAVATYRLNLSDEIYEVDLTTVDADLLPRADVLLGGFPCQDFSSCGPKVGLAGKRGRLYRVMVDYMEAHRPRIVVGENVPHLARLGDGKHLRQILDEFEAVGYRFAVWEMYGPDFGLPQSRRRLFIVGARGDLPGHPVKPKPTHVGSIVPIDAALQDLETINDESVPNQSQYFVATRATAGGGQGDHANCRGTVAYCIRANARGRIQFHYSLDRRLTVRECARLQAFPDEFVFPYSTQRNLTLIGNAVPPILAHRVADSIRGYLRHLDRGDSPSGVGKVPARSRQPSLFSSPA